MCNNFPFEYINPKILERLKQLSVKFPAVAVGIANLQADITLHCNAVLAELDSPMPTEGLADAAHALAGMADTVGAVTLARFARTLMTQQSFKSGLIEMSQQLAEIRDRTNEEIGICLGL